MLPAILTSEQASNYDVEHLEYPGRGYQWTIYVRFATGLMSYSVQ